jgi:AraC-like DNA-binding protein
LNERDKVRVKDEPPRGILNVRPAESSNGLTRYWPSAELAPFVEHYWIVRWDLDAPRVAETVPHPSIHMVLEAGRSEVVGVLRRKFSRVLEGRGRVVGTKFRPGAFRPFAGQAVSALTDRRLGIETVFGRGARPLEDAALRHAEDLPAIAVVEAFLRERRPQADDAMHLAGRVTARIAEDRGITRVDQLAQEFHTTTRQLQRVFGAYVGVSPKWVIQRYRLLEAVERVAAGSEVDWADLALELRYADQAHFIRDFKKLVGRSPADYARSLQAAAQA